MADYKGIHERISENNYRYSEGWKQTHSGMWFLAGLITGLVTMLVVVM